MKKIYKYGIVMEGLPDLKLHLPKGAKVVHVGTQAPGQVNFWVELPPMTVTYENRLFRVYETGHPIEDEAIWCGTTMDGPFVWHLYEISS